MRTGNRGSARDVRLIPHIFDCQVAAAVAAKGSSPSRVLDRVCRRLASVSLSSNAIVVSLLTLSGWQRCGVTVVPKHATDLLVSSVVISNSWVLRTPHSRVTPWPRNASGRTVISLSGTYLALLVNLISTLGNTSTTFFTMITLSNGAVIRWQPFGASRLLGATALAWRKLISVTGAELNMCECCFPFPGGLAGVLRLSRSLRLVARGGYVVCFFMPTVYG